MSVHRWLIFVLKNGIAQLCVSGQQLNHHSTIVRILNSINLLKIYVDYTTLPQCWPNIGPTYPRGNGTNVGPTLAQLWLIFV